MQLSCWVIAAEVGHRAAAHARGMHSNSFVAGLFSLHPCSKGRMLTLVESKDQGAHNEIGRKRCIALMGILEAVMYAEGCST